MSGIICQTCQRIFLVTFTRLGEVFSHHAVTQAEEVGLLGTRKLEEDQETLLGDDDRGASAGRSPGQGGRGLREVRALQTGFLQALSGDRDDLLG